MKMEMAEMMAAAVDFPVMITLTLLLHIRLKVMGTYMLAQCQEYREGKLRTLVFDVQMECMLIRQLVITILACMPICLLRRGLLLK